MTRIFEATCAGGVVTANGAVVPNCPIVGEGGTSSGYLVVCESDLFYLPKITPDTVALITQLENLCDKISALTVISSVPGNPSSTPTNAADFAAIKEQLTSLKGALR